MVSLVIKTNKQQQRHSENINKNMDAQKKKNNNFCKNNQIAKKLNMFFKDFFKGYRLLMETIKMLTRTRDYK